MTVWGVSTGGLGISFGSEGVFQQPLLSWDFLTLIHEIFDVRLDDFLCHCNNFIDCPENDAVR